MVALALIQALACAIVDLLLRLVSENGIIIGQIRTKDRNHREVNQVMVCVNWRDQVGLLDTGMELAMAKNGLILRADWENLQVGLTREGISAIGNLMAGLAQKEEKLCQGDQRPTKQDLHEAPEWLMGLRKNHGIKSPLMGQVLPLVRGPLQQRKDPNFGPIKYTWFIV